jgi:hypothetical protein
LIVITIIIIIFRDPEVAKQLESSAKKGNESLFKALFGRSVCTLTGRVRGKVGFTQACNTPFSGLAADGAKLAMWNLMQVYAFINTINQSINQSINQLTSLN